MTAHRESACLSLDIMPSRDSRIERLESRIDVLERTSISVIHNNVKSAEQNIICIRDQTINMCKSLTTQSDCSVQRMEALIKLVDEKVCDGRKAMEQFGRFLQTHQTQLSNLYEARTSLATSFQGQRYEVMQLLAEANDKVQDAVGQRQTLEARLTQLKVDVDNAHQSIRQLKSSQVPPNVIMRSRSWLQPLTA